MPEYLSPGVFVEEVPPRLRALEGVSTSTAAFVGAAERGPVAGFNLPFTPANGFLLSADPAPVLVTSFADFTRQFGQPLPLPSSPGDPDFGYLGYAVRAFFDNGGKRLYVSRIVHQGVDPLAATRSTLPLPRGVVIRLLRPVKGGSNQVFLSSLRNLNVGDAVTFLRRSDGTNALVLPAQPATLVGTGVPVEPFALAPGDTVSLSVNGGPAVVMPTIQAAPVELESASGPFAGITGQTLQIKVGALPTQTVTFTGTSATQVALDIAASIAGVAVSVDVTDNVHLLSDHKGSGAALSITGGTAAATLAFTAAPAGSNNVADVDRVTIAELAAIFSGIAPPFSVDADPTGHIRFTTTATGSGVTIAFTPSATATKLGLGTATAGSGGGAPVNPVIASYNTKEGSVTFTSAIPNDLDPADVYAVRPLPNAPVPGGPTFWGRSPGSWSQQVSVLVTPSDRAAVPLLAAAGAASTTIDVQSTNSFYAGAVVEVDHDGSQRTYHQVTDINGKTLTLTPALGSAVVNPANSFARVLEIDVTINDESGSAPIELYKGLTWSQGGASDLRRHYGSVINARSRLVYVQPPVTEAATPVAAPTTPNGFPVKFSVIGKDGLPISDDDYIGTDGGPGLRTGIESLKDVSEARIIAAPGRTTPAVQLALISQCELLRYRFAILDGEQDPLGGSLNSILAHRNLYDSSFAAYYTPWLGVSVGDEVRYLPPSGFVAGIYARVDNQRSVGKAPANEAVFNVVKLKTNFTTGEQDILNPRGVDVIRRFDRGGIRVWGARTLSSDPALKYVNVRRALIFIEASIDQGTQWVVFEPNVPDTWSRVTDTIRSFLETQWRSGLLFGRTPEQAFFVRCDETTMTADDVQNGRLICQIGLALVRPAEFVIFRIEQITGFAQQ